MAKVGLVIEGDWFIGKFGLSAQKSDPLAAYGKASGRMNSNWVLAERSKLDGGSSAVIFSLMLKTSYDGSFGYPGKNEVVEHRI
jgi:hypothetical protein